MTDCLTNCTYRGLCVPSSENKFTCECQKNFGGPSCQNDLRPCASKPCLNNATCLDSFNSENITVNESFKCECGEYFYGTNCQFEVNICQNETCSNNGYCYKETFKPKCKCFNLYSGDKCEIESDEKKVIKNVVKTTSIIAIVILVFSYLSFILIDINSLFTIKKKTKNNKIQKFKIYKFKYVVH